MGTIRKSYIAIERRGMAKMDTIEHDGAWWLVPNWLLSPDKRQMRPLRIVFLRSNPPKPMGYRRSNLVVSHSVPEGVFRGAIPPERADEFVVIENPDLWFPNPDVLN